MTNWRLHVTSHEVKGEKWTFNTENITADISLNQVTWHDFSTNCCWTDVHYNPLIFEKHIKLINGWMSCEDDVDLLVL